MARLTDCSLIPEEAKVLGNCNWCGKRLPRTASGMIHATRRWCSSQCSWEFSVNHFWTNARNKALKLAKWRCSRCRSVHQLEVNHIIPLVGRGYHSGCCHHQENLEVVCHSCHVTITKRQREIRKRVQEEKAKASSQDL